MPQHIKKGYARGIGADGHSGSLRESAKDLMNGRTWCTASHKSFASTTECGRCALSRTGLCPLLRGTNGATQRRSTRKRSFAKTDATVCSNYTISIVLFLHKHFLPCLQPGICRHVLTRSPEKAVNAKRNMCSRCFIKGGFYQFALSDFQFISESRVPVFEGAMRAMVQELTNKDAEERTKDRKGNSK